MSAGGLRLTRSPCGVAAAVSEVEVPDGERGGGQVAAQVRAGGASRQPGGDPRRDGRVRRAAAARQPLGDDHAAGRAGLPRGRPHPRLLLREYLAPPTGPLAPVHANRSPFAGG